MCSAGPVTYHETSAQPQTPYPSQTYGLISGWSCAEPGVGPDDPFNSIFYNSLTPAPSLQAPGHHLLAVPGIRGWEPGLSWHNCGARAALCQERCSSGLMAHTGDVEDITAQAAHPHRDNTYSSASALVFLGEQLEIRLFTTLKG